MRFFYINLLCRHIINPDRGWIFIIIPRTPNPGPHTPNLEPRTPNFVPRTILITFIQQYAFVINGKLFFVLI